jgi:hypothetical protein
VDNHAGEYRNTESIYPIRRLRDFHTEKISDAPLSTSPSSNRLGPKVGSGANLRLSTAPQIKWRPQLGRDRPKD